MRKVLICHDFCIAFCHFSFISLFHSTEWKLEDNNQLRNLYHSSYCVRPAGGIAAQGVNLEIVRSGCHEFGFTTKGSLQHKSSGLCIQTQNKVKNFYELLYCYGRIIKK